VSPTRRCTCSARSASGSRSTSNSAGERLRSGRQRPSPTYFRFEPEPVRATVSCDALPLAGRRTETQLDAIVYDFGALTLCYEVRFEGTLEDWVALSAAATADRASTRRMEILEWRIILLIALGMLLPWL